MAEVYSDGSEFATEYEVRVDRVGDVIYRGGDESVSIDVRSMPVEALDALIAALSAARAERG